MAKYVVKTLQMLKCAQKIYQLSKSEMGIRCHEVHLYKLLRDM